MAASCNKESKVLVNDHLTGDYTLASLFISIQQEDLEGFRKRTEAESGLLNGKITEIEGI